MLAGTLLLGAISWVCVDDGLLSRRQLCYQNGVRSGDCTTLAKELWTDLKKPKPSWAVAVNGNSYATSSRRSDVLQFGTETASPAACGDGTLTASAEQCDDLNTIGGDGCAIDCTVELGWSCFPSVTNGVLYSSNEASASACVRNTCGDNFMHPTEQCDDGNVVAGDGCSDMCIVEPDFHCVNSESRTVCSAPRCGDAKKSTVEECDDGNTEPLDGCDAICRLEQTALYECHNICSGSCQLYEEQDRTICVPLLESPMPTDAGPERTATITMYKSLTMTATETVVGPLENRLTWNASEMKHVKGPCGRMLNNQLGCCGHLAEVLPSAAERMIDLTRCRWPRVGYVRVSEADNCTVAGFLEVTAPEDCASAAGHLGLLDTSPRSLGNDTSETTTIVNLSLPVPPELASNKQFEYVERLEGQYVRRGYERYEKLGFALGTAPFMVFDDGRWYLYSNSNELKWSYSTRKFIGDWSGHGLEEDTKASTNVYPIVQPAGSWFPGGCSYSRHSTEYGQLIFQTHDKGTDVPCSDDAECLCRLDENFVSTEDYSPEVDAHCSYLLHQLYCGYSCLAPYVPSTELACRDDSYCPIGSTCIIPQSKYAAVKAKEKELEEALASEASEDDFCIGWTCDKTSQELQSELDELVANLVGGCSGTGTKAPVCRSWLQKVYAVCRQQPVAYFDFSKHLDPPLPHCQPMWWRYRTFDAFVDVYPDAADSEGCWSVATSRAPNVLLVLLALAAPLFWVHAPPD